MFPVRRRLATWVVATVALPLVVRTLRRASDSVESRHGPTANSARLQHLAELAGQLPDRLSHRRQ